MSAAARVLKNTFFLMAAKSIYLLLSFFFYIYVAKYVGVENFGTLNASIALCGILGIGLDLGITRYLVRDIAREQSLNEKLIKNSLSFKLISGVAFLCIIYGVTFVLGYTNQKTVVTLIIAIYFFIQTLNSIYIGFFSGKEKMNYVALEDILLGLVLLIGLYAIIQNDLSFIAVVILYPFSQITLLLISNIILASKYFIPIPEIDKGYITKIISKSYPFGLSAAFVTIFYQIDSVMLSILVDDTAVGIYNAAYRLVFTILILRTIVHSAVFPQMAKCYVNNSLDYLQNICDSVFKYLFIIIIPIAIGTTILAPKIIETLYGTQYIKSAAVLQLLIWSDVIIFVNSFPRIFEALGKEMTLMKINALGVIFNIVLNLILIHYYSYIGASIATVATEFLIIITSYKILGNKTYNIKNSNFLRKIPLVLFSGLVMGLFTVYLVNYNLIFTIVCSAFIYLILLTLTKSVQYSEYKNLIDNIKK
jgi:O-antigen/teichoic acid export membrane protein